MSTEHHCNVPLEYGERAVFSPQYSSSPSQSSTATNTDCQEDRQDNSVNDLPTPPPSASSKKKRRKKKPKKGAKSEGTSTAGDETNGPEGRPPGLCISRNKHWKYISSYHVRVIAGILTEYLIDFYL